MENFDIVVPTVDVMHYFDDLMEANHRLRTNLSLQNSELRTARDLLLPRLMSGRLTL
jgi:hypothetical protein